MAITFTKFLENKYTNSKSAYADGELVSLDRLFKIEQRLAPPPQRAIETEVESMCDLFKTGLVSVIIGICFGIASNIIYFERTLIVSAIFVVVGSIIMMLSVLGEPKHDKFK